MKLVASKLSHFKDAINTDRNETTPSAWHGMWIKDKKFDRLIAPLPEPQHKKPKKNKKTNK